MHTKKAVGDGDPCTKDSCKGGVILHEKIPECAGCSVEKEAVEKLCDDENPCTIETCTPCTGMGCKGGVCATKISDNGTNVDDGNLCNGVDTCVNGKAKQTTPVPPGLDDNNVCTKNECDKATGKVTHPPVDGLDDGKRCTENKCDPVTGTSFPSVPFSDTNPCTINERCTEQLGPTSDLIAGCLTCEDDAKCQLPNQPCLELKCEGGKCTKTNRLPGDSGTEPCSDQKEPCATHACDAGACVRTPKPDTTTKCDGNTLACDGTAVCIGGKCNSVPPTMVGPRTSCKVPTCMEPNGDVVDVPVGGTCQSCNSGQDCNAPPASFDS